MIFRKNHVAPSPSTNNLFNINDQDGHQLVDVLTCVVCLEVMSEPCVLDCGHIICFSCWQDWKDTERNITCPTCRAVEPVELKTQSEVMKKLAHSLLHTQPCGMRVSVNNRYAHESQCAECISVPMIRERVIDAEQSHIVHYMRRSQKRWEVDQVAKLQQRKGREWEIGESESRYRRFASLRVRNAISAMFDDYKHVPRYVIDWSHKHRNVYGKIQVPLKIRTWLDATERQYC